MNFCYHVLSGVCVYISVHSPVRQSLYQKIFHILDFFSNAQANLNQTWYKAYLSKVNSRLLKVTSSFKARVNLELIIICSYLKSLLKIQLAKKAASRVEALSGIVDSFVQIMIPGCNVGPIFGIEFLHRNK